MRELSNRLAGARSAREIGEHCAAASRELVGVSSFNMMTLGGAEPSPEQGFAFSDEVPQELIWGKMVECLPLTAAATPPAAIAPDRTTDLAVALAATGIEHSELYESFWHPCRIERQLLHFVANEDEIVGSIVLTRTARERPFDEADRRTLHEMGVVVGRALAALRIPGLDAGPLGLLGALCEGLPVAVLVFDACGRLAWLSDAAVLRFGAECVRLGAGSLLLRASSPLAPWRALARLVAAQPGAAVAGLPGACAAMLAPGERAAVRRVEGGGGAGTHVVVTLQPASRRARVDAASLGLSPREAEVAELAAEGYALINIAARLGIAASTVKTHLKHVYDKLGVASRAELATRVC